MNTVEAAIAKVLPDIFESATPTEHVTGSPDVIPEGQRDSTLTQVAGKLRRVGFPPETIAAALHVENRRRCAPPLSDFDIEKIARSVGRYHVDPAAHPAHLIGLTLDSLAGHIFPDRKVLLTRDGTAVFREGHIGQVYAERGFGKTWFLQTVALVAAGGGEALGFRAPAPSRVLYVDGEMASEEIKARFALLGERLSISQTAALTIVAADWQDQYLPRLDTDTGQGAIEPFIEAADLVVLDNRSCLFDPEGEKDASAWQATQDWLLSLRRRGKGVLLAHHSNRQGGARGHSKAEDTMNLLIRLARPEDYCQDQGARFVATFDKCRGAFGAAVAPFLAHLTPEGWRTQSVEPREQSAAERLREYVRLAQQAGERPASASAAITGARMNRNVGFEAWATLLKNHTIVKHPEGGFYVP